MRKLFSTLLFAVVALFFSSCGEKVYYASDYGIVPNTGKDMTKPIARAIEIIKNEYIIKFIDFNGQVVIGQTVETAEMTYKLPKGFKDDFNNPGYFFNEQLTMINGQLWYALRA